jgi:hypothetical protein
MGGGMSRNKVDVASLLVAASIWGVALSVVLTGVLAGRITGVPFETYFAAAERWRAHQPLYETRSIDGFQYFPHSAVLFAPFTLFGARAANVLWRALWWGLYALGIERVAVRLVPERAGIAFLIATCLAVGPALGSLENGQANLALGALSLHVAADLNARRWWRATLLLVGGLALKPLMAPLLLLVWALYRPMAWRLLCALLAAAIAPLLLGDASYWIAQYSACITKLGMTSTPNRLFEDVRGLFASFGWLMPHPLYFALRSLAAVGALWVCWRARHNLCEPQATVLVAAIAVGYLMLFNPRTLASSYAIASCMAGLLAAAYFFERRPAAALTLALSTLAWTVNRHWLGFGFIQGWLKPGACLAFDGLLIWEAVSPLQRWRTSNVQVAQAVAGDGVAPSPQPAPAVAIDPS